MNTNPEDMSLNQALQFFKEGRPFYNIETNRALDVLISATKPYVRGREEVNEDKEREAFLVINSGYRWTGQFFVSIPSGEYVSEAEAHFQTWMSSVRHSVQSR